MYIRNIYIYIYGFIYIIIIIIIIKRKYKTTFLTILSFTFFLHDPQVKVVVKIVVLFFLFIIIYMLQFINYWALLSYYINIINIYIYIYIYIYMYYIYQLILYISAIRFAELIQFWQDPKCRRNRTFWRKKFSVSLEKYFIFRFHIYFCASFASYFLVSDT